MPKEQEPFELTVGNFLGPCRSQATTFCHFPPLGFFGYVNVHNQLLGLSKSQLLAVTFTIFNKHAETAFLRKLFLVH